MEGNATLGKSSIFLEVGFSVPHIDSILERSVRDAFPSLTFTPPDSGASDVISPRISQDFSESVKRS